MGFLAPVILGIADAVGQGLVTKYQTDKLADAYADAANQVRMAANKYSGQAADSAMTQEGARQGQQIQKLAQSQGQAGTSGLSNVDAMTGMNNVQNNGLSGYMQGQNLGRSNKEQELNSKYNAATIAAQNMLSRANTDFNVGNQALKLATNSIGGLLQGYGNIGGSAGMNSLTQSAANMFSDENCKESITNSSGDKIPVADAADALRQIESIEYQYKPEMGLDNDKHVGISAQSLEGTALDNGTVKSEPGKFKTLDKQKLLESTLAGIAALQKEIDSLKSGKKIDSLKSGKEMVSDVQLKEAVDNKEPNKVENIVENSNNPTKIVKDAGLEQTPLMQEAKQINDGDKRTDEVNNKAVEETIDWNSLEKKAEEEHNKIQRGESITGFDKVDKFDPNAEDYVPPVMEQDFDLKKALMDYGVSAEDAIDIADYGLEDQNQYPETINQDETVIDNKMSNSPIAETEPAEGFENIDNAVQLVNNGKEEEALDLVEKEAEDKEEEEPEEKFRIGMLGSSLGKPTTFSNTSIPVSNPKEVNFDSSNIGSPILGNLLNSINTPSGSISAPNVSSSIKKPEELTSNISSKAIGGSIPDSLDASKELNVKQGSKMNSYSTNNGGTVNSGATKTNGTLTNNSPELPSFTGHTDTSDNITIDSLKEATIENLISKIMEMDDDKAKANEINKEELTYKGVSIKKLPPEQLNELIKIVGE